MSKSPDTSSNTDTSTEYPKSDIFDHHISFISQNVQSLRSDSQSINLDAIIEKKIVIKDFGQEQL